MTNCVRTWSTAPKTLVAFAIVLLTVVPATLAACYLPARRAMRVDPNVTLKSV